MSLTLFPKEPRAAKVIDEISGVMCLGAGNMQFTHRPTYT